MVKPLSLWFSVILFIILKLMILWNIIMITGGFKGGGGGRGITVPGPALMVAKRAAHLEKINKKLIKDFLVLSRRHKKERNQRVSISTKKFQRKKLQTGTNQSTLNSKIQVTTLRAPHLFQIITE